MSMNWEENDPEQKNPMKTPEVHRKSDVPEVPFIPDVDEFLREQEQRDKG